MIVGGLMALVAVLVSAAPLDATGETLVRHTVRLALAWYAAALLLMMRLRPGDWDASTMLGRVVRWCWTWGILCFVVHLAAAFQFFHFWSHEHAYQVTRDVSGVGEGIYALYFFIGAWLIDAAWWWAAPQSYAARSRIVDRTLHGFMLFIVFNGMIVYERGFIRWAGIVMFTALAGSWLLSRPLRRSLT